MQKSIFRRYLSISMSIVILSFAMLGSVMMLFFSSYWRNEKKELLTQNAMAIAHVAEKYFAADGQPFFDQNGEVLRGFAASFAHSSEADLFITDLNGQVLMGNIGGQDVSRPLQAPLTAVKAASAGLFERVDTFGDIYTTAHYVVGVPVQTTQEGDCAAVVFAAASVRSIRAFRIEVLKIFLIASAAALAVTFCLVGLFAYRQVRPLRQMSAAARQFGAGDFSVRVPVESNDELGQLAQPFNHMANSLSISEGTRRSFIANVSHELKTPMTTIAGFIDGILDGTIPPAEQEKYLTIVSSEVKRLSRLVRSMLDLSRIDNGEMQLHPKSFDLTATVVSTLLTFEKSIEEKNIDVRGLEDARPEIVSGDQDLLHQVVYNLLENAVKFTDPGGYIQIQISGGIDRTTVIIENSGAGISPEELPHIFERFYKTDKSRSQDKNGMGLGLYIVQTILKLHGGDISVRSQVGSFCRFEFYLPKPQEAPRLKDASAPKLKESRSRDKEKNSDKNPEKE